MKQSLHAVPTTAADTMIGICRQYKNLNSDILMVIHGKRGMKDIGLPLGTMIALKYAIMAHTGIGILILYISLGLAPTALCVRLIQIR